MESRVLCRLQRGVPGVAGKLYKTTASVIENNAMVAPGKMWQLK